MANEDKSANKVGDKEEVIYYTSFEINGKKVDLLKALPMTLKDWRVLKERGVSGDKLAEMEGIETYARYLITKANPEISDDDIDLLTQTELTQILNCVNQITSSGAIDRSFLKPLTVLPSTTDGAKNK